MQSHNWITALTADRLVAGLTPAFGAQKARELVTNSAGRGPGRSQRPPQEKLISTALRTLRRALRGLVAGAQSIPLGDNSAESRALAQAVAAARLSC
jgi:hypothetical protein